jgi:GT2 family glycosyltransferase
MNKKVSVVVLTHNRAEYTRWCLKGLLKTTYRPLEIVFVDNGSTDETVSMLREFSFPSDDVTCTVIKNPDNVGCSTARNQGAEASNGAFIVFMDNDVVVRTTRWIEGLIEPFADKTVRASSPKLVFPFPPYLIQFAGAAVSPSGKVQFMGRGEPISSNEHNKRKDLQCTISACVLMHADSFREAGGFDEAFNPVQYEDIDLSYRLRQSGYRIVHVPEVEMYHFENVTTQGSPDVRGTYRIIKHGMLFKKRWHSMFSKEDGPLDEEVRWKEIKKHDISEIGDLEFI